MKANLLVAALAMAAIATPAAAVVNPGFETGDFSGWNVNGPSAVVTMSTSASTWAPFAGSFFATLQGGQTDVYSTLSQTFKLAENQIISGVVGYQSNDIALFEDDAYLTVGSLPLFTASNFTVGGFGNTGWTAWSFTAPITGSYTLELGVRNTGDSDLAPLAFLDATVTTSVPEPQSWALMIVGFGLVGAATRRREAVRAA